jgi:dihydrofolate reductase
MGGADTIRQALRAGYVDELSVSIAPVVLGAGKRLFEGFDTSLNLEVIRTFSSPLATHVKYRVVRAAP